METKLKVCYTFDRARLINALILARGALCVRATEYEDFEKKSIRSDFNILRDLTRALLDMDPDESVELMGVGK